MSTAAVEVLTLAAAATDGLDAETFAATAGEEVLDASGEETLDPTLTAAGLAAATAVVVVVPFVTRLVSIY